MEVILKELNLSHFSDKLRSKNVNIGTFQFLMRPSSSAMSASMKQIVMTDCGLTSGQVLAICDKIAESMKKEEAVRAKQPEKQTTPVAYAKAGSKRLSKLLNLP